MITFKSAESALKSVYLNAVVDQLNTTINPFYSQIAHTSNDIVGKDVVRVVRKSLPSGISVAVNDDADLPESVSSDFATFRSPLKNLFGQISITDKAIKASAHSEGAFVNLLNNEMEGLLTQAKIMMGRLLFVGQKGKIAQVIENTNDGRKKVKVKDYVRGMTNAKLFTIAENYNNYSQPYNNSIVSESVEGGYQYITLSESKNHSIGDIFSLSDDINATISGLGVVVDYFTTIYGVHKGYNSWMEGLRYNAQRTETLTEELLQRAFDTITERSGESPNLILTSYYARRSLIRDLNSYRRNVDFTELKGGFKALTFNGVPVVADRFCPIERAYLINTKDFAMHQLGDWAWIENEGGNVLHQIPGKAAYSATLVKYAELMCDKPYAQGVIEGLNLTD